MPSIGVNIAIMQDDKILLTMREDFPVWCLPGGAVEDGESVAQAAIREAREETGLEVELTRLVGIYSRPEAESDFGSSHAVVFAARMVGGALQPDPHEVRDARYCDPRELPDALIWWQRQRILDAVNGVGGSVAWTQHTTAALPRGITRAELYAMRDRGELPIEQALQWLCEKPSGASEVLEVTVGKRMGH